MSTVPPGPPKPPNAVARKPSYRANISALAVLPDDLKERDQFVNWDYKVKENKWGKIPLQANGNTASSTDSTTWSDYETSVTAFRQRPAEFTGIGFVLSVHDPFCCIDLDDCLVSGRPKDYLLPLLHIFGDTYMEVSPSGNGLKIFFKCKLPGSGIPKNPNTKFPFEMYDAGRYVVVTGLRFNDAPLELTEHQVDGETLYWDYKKARPVTAPAVNGTVMVEHPNRHNFLLKHAGSLRAKGYSTTLIKAALQVLNMERCSPPYDADHVSTLADSGERWEPGELEIPPVNAEKKNKEEPRVDIDTIASVHSVDSSGIEFAVGGIIAMSAVTAITGDSGAGKTTFTSKLAYHVSIGEDFLGRKCTARPVLILDRENTLPIVQERLKRLGIQDGQALKYWGPWLAEEAPVPGASVIQAWVLKCEVKPLIIVDSFIAFLDGDENDASTVRAFMQQPRDLATLGAAVVVLHHSGKGETTRDYRGSSDFKASLDVGYVLTNMGEGQLDKLRFKAFKTRFPVDNDIVMQYSDGVFSAVGGSQAVTQTVTTQLTELLRRNPRIRQKEFEDLAVGRGLGRNRARQFLELGQETGVVRLVKGHHNSRHFELVDGISDKSLEAMDLLDE